MNSKGEKIFSRVMLVLLIVSLVPIIYLGRFNHPTGDDYYYTATTHLIWEETGSLRAVLAGAARGVAEEYQIWQGTYSAMFLMYLAPNLFGEWAYKCVTGVIIAALVGGIFYFLKPLICAFLKGSKHFWVIVSSLLSLLCIETVAFRSESFFWYNGSMYYTGFFAGTLVLFGVLLRWLQKASVGKLIAMVLLALFLAGGNYVSLLPTLLLVLSVAVCLLFRKDKRFGGVFLVALALLCGLAVSALAPGNSVRQSDMWKIPAWKAVLKSLLQGVNYFVSWTGIWWIVVAAVATPLLWRTFKNIEFKFPLPILAVGYMYGIFCSMSCPTFYTMNTTGPARAVAIVYYGYVLISFLCYGYLLGYVRKKFGSRFEEISKKTEFRDRVYIICLKYAFGAVAGVLLAVQLFSGGVKEITTVKAIGILISGEAAAYEQEYQERLAILNDASVTDVVLKPYENRPEMLYVGDFSADVNQPTNVKAAVYFRKNSVKVEH